MIQIIGGMFIQEYFYSLYKVFFKSNINNKIQVNLNNFKKGTWMMQTAFVVWPQSDKPAYIWNVSDHRQVTWLKVG